MAAHIVEELIKDRRLELNHALYSFNTSTKKRTFKPNHTPHWSFLNSTTCQCQLNALKRNQAAR